MKLWRCPVKRRWTRGSAPPGIAWSDATLPAMPEPQRMICSWIASKRSWWAYIISSFAYCYCIILPCKSLKYSRSSHQHYDSWHSVRLDVPDFRSFHLRSRTNTSAIATWLGTTAPSVLGIHLHMNHAYPTDINQWCCEATSTSDKWVWSPVLSCPNSLWLRNDLRCDALQDTMRCHEP